MFTGLIQAVGTVTAHEHAGGESDLDVDLGPIAEHATVGASIALSGVCCTVVSCEGSVARFHLSPETLDRTWLGDADAGHAVNLEPALLAGQPLGGHLVQGHVDGVGHCTRAIDAKAGGELGISIPEDLRRYCVEKGSITIDGVSLTIAGPEKNDADETVGAWIAVIPHTAEVTTLGRLQPGDAVHLEVDVLAKYVEQMLAARGLG